MQNFEYQAIDRQGKTVSGVVQANSRDEAARSLSVSGLLVSQVTPQDLPNAGGLPRVIVPPTRSVTAPPQVSPQRLSQVSPTASAGYVAKQNLASPMPDPPLVRFKGTDKQLSFLFGQFASMVRSGLNIGLAADHLAQRSSTKRYSESLQAVSKRTGEGQSLSDVLRSYPELYPPHVIGLIQAGELSGQLPAALTQVADWAAESHGFKRRFIFTKLTLLSNILLFPFIWAVVRGSIVCIHLQDQAGGTLPEKETLIKAVRGELPQAILQVGIGLAILFALRYLLFAGKLTMLRHRAILTLPALGGRARAESLTKFAWAFGEMSKAGISPKRAWDVSAAAMPNLELAWRMRMLGLNHRENVSATQLMREDPRLVPPDYADILETGQLSGDIGGSMNMIARMSNTDFSTRDQHSKFALMFYTYIPAGIMVLYLSFFLYKAFYVSLFDVLTKDDSIIRLPPFM